MEQSRGAEAVRAGSFATLPDAARRGQPVRGRASGKGRHAVRDDLPPEGTPADADSRRCEVIGQQEHGEQQGESGHVADRLRAAGWWAREDVSDAGAQRCDGRSEAAGCEERPGAGAKRGGQNVSDAASIRQPRPGEFSDACNCAEDRKRKTSESIHVRFHGKWPAEPDVGRVVDGLAARVDRLKAIGNGQVPRVAAAAFAELSRHFC